MRWAARAGDGPDIRRVHDLSVIPSCKNLERRRRYDTLNRYKIQIEAHSFRSDRSASRAVEPSVLPCPGGFRFALWRIVDRHPCASGTRVYPSTLPEPCAG